MTMTYTRKAVQGASMILFMSLLASLLAYFMRVILARHLGPEEFGLFYAVFTFIIFFLFFRDLGFPKAIIKYVAEFKVLGQYGKIKSAILAVLSVQLVSSFIFGLAIYLFAPYLALTYFKNPEATSLLRLLIWYIFGSVLFIISKDTLL